MYRSTKCPQVLSYILFIEEFNWTVTNDSYGSGSLAAGRATNAGQVLCDLPDKKRYSGHPGWGFGMGLTSSTRKNSVVYNPLQRVCHGPKPGWNTIEEKEDEDTTKWLWDRLSCKRELRDHEVDHSVQFYRDHEDMELYLHFSDGVFLKAEDSIHFSVLHSLQELQPC
jgi:hypothetical protein